MQSNESLSEPVGRLAEFGNAGWGLGLASVPAAMQRWLTLGTSLTAGVRAVSAHFRVQREMEAWRRPLRDEARLLGVSKRQRVWTREVTLRDGDQPLVYAHTIAARPSLPAWPWLRGLGDRPLGEVLFEHPGVTRLPLEFRRLDARHPLYQSALRQIEVSGQRGPQCLYARRSVFVLLGRPLLVTELFFPALLERTKW